MDAWFTNQTNIPLKTEHKTNDYTLDETLTVKKL